MARIWLIDSKGLARKVKNATVSAAYQIKDSGACHECPICHYHIDNADVSPEWLGLPAGVKFDPSDMELLEHLAAKCGVGNSEPHLFVDEFIPTLESEEGICYTHPENLPGAKKDGSSVHFFYKTINAYATGQRKRRKIHSQLSSTKEHVRWHKTGKTKPVMENGVQKGCKKIMVLYRTSKKGSKPDKSNWIMHQYHLGTDEDEKEGQFVVSKIFYQQQKQTDRNDNPLKVEESDVGMIQTSPMTPNTNTPIPPRPEKPASCDDVTYDHVPKSSTQEAKSMTKSPLPPSTAVFKDDMEYSAWLAGESQATDINATDDPLLCNEIFNSYASLDDLVLNHDPFTGFVHNSDDFSQEDRKTTTGISNLKNLELDTSDFHLADLQFGSQDSILSWLDWL